MIGYLGLYCLLLTFAKPTDSNEIFTIFNEKDENAQKTHNAEKRKPFPHDTFEFAFPFFNDLFPLTGLNIKPKEISNKKKIKDDDGFMDFISSDQDSPFLDYKGNKKNGKDKLIMSFTELFIPFKNHKNDLESNIKKHDIFDDIFNIFPFVDFEDGIIDKHNSLTTKKHKNSKRKNVVKNINTTNLEKLFETIEGGTIGAFPKFSRITKFEPKFVKPKEETLTKTNDNDHNETCCKEQKQCVKDGACAAHRCDENQKLNNDENNSIKKSILLDKTFLICAIPGLIGFGALIFGIEVLRRHNELVKQTPFLSQYNQIQTC